MDNKIKKEDLWCEYSDMPSPLAYYKCADYDSMGNHGRFPISKHKVKNKKKIKLLFSLFKKLKNKKLGL